MNRTAWALVAAAGMLGTGAGASAQTAPAPMRAGPMMDSGLMPELVRTYAEDRADLLRFYDVEWSDARLDRAERLIAEWETRLAGVAFDALPSDQRVDWLLLRDHLRGERQRLALRRSQRAEMEPAIPFRPAIEALERGRTLMEPVDARQAAAAVVAVRDQVKALRERVRPAGKKPEGEAKDRSEPLTLTPTVARRAAGAVAGLRNALARWNQFHSGYRPDFSWWVRQPFDETAKELDEYAKKLREEIAGLKGKDEDPLVGDPIGREALLAELELEAIPFTPEELIAIGERELAWCQDQMRRAAAEMGLGDDWRAALERVKNAHVPPGEQDDLVATQAREAIAFLKQRDLVTVPALAEETWRLTMLSPEGQRTLPFAAYGGQAMLVAYPTDAMAHGDKLMAMRGNNRHFTRIVTAHELIPGHHLQSFMADRVRPYRGVFRTPFFVEGWALYWEMLLWDKGFAQSPEDRLGMLFWRAHRAARIVVSLEFHLGRMTPPQMIDLLVDRVGHERFGATSEVRRYVAGDYGPLYQVSYMIGGVQLMALRRELVDAGGMPEKAFHDALLTHGSIPVEYIRAEMTGEALRADRRARWRFVEPPAPDAAR